MMHALVRRSLLLLVLMLCLSSLLFLQVSAEESSVVYDYADEFTDEEIAEITAAARAKTAECGAQIVIVTTQTWGYDGEDFLLQHSDYSGDLILLIITNYLDTYYYDLYTYGRADSLIKGTEVDLILDDPDVFYNLKGGNLFDGTMAFVEVASKAYAERIAFPMKDVIVGSLVIALIISLVISGVIIARYRMKLKPTNYPLDQYAKLKLNERSDIFIGKHNRGRYP